MKLPPKNLWDLAQWVRRKPTGALHELLQGHNPERAAIKLISVEHHDDLIRAVEHELAVRAKGPHQ